MQDHNIAKLIAAHFVLGMHGIESSSVTLDKYNNVVVSGHKVGKRDMCRIGVLKHVILDMAGEHEQLNVSNMLCETRPYKSDATWAFATFGFAFIGIIGYFQHCCKVGEVVPIDELVAT